MSQIVTTKLGRFRAVTDGTRKWWLWECRCGTWCNLSTDQMEGRVSVDHASHRHLYPMPGTLDRMVLCTYHETHEFAKELVTTIQARLLTRGQYEPLFEEEA